MGGSNSYKHSVLAHLLTMIVVYFLGYLSIQTFGNYGWLVFCFLPFLVGFMPVYLRGRQSNLTKKQAYSTATVSAGLNILGLLVFAIEGVICIGMASPFLFLFIWVGAFLGFKLSSRRKAVSTKTTITSLVLISLGFMSFDSINEPKNLIPVTTTVVVNAPIETVWNNVVTFDTIAEPTDWVFKTGVSYPTNATIVGKGVGAIRYCNFTTGSFVEPITTWEKPNLLQFNVQEQPTPMNELNPFWEVHPPHLDGYFKSYKGQFQLTKLSEGQTQLAGTTWYKVDINPEFYWKAWSDFIVHRIHKRVLNHIKAEAEQE